MRDNFIKLGLILIAITAIAFFSFSSKNHVRASDVVTVSGAGNADYNGQYNENGTAGGKTAYSLDASHWLWWKADVTRWMLSPAIGIVPVTYHGNLTPDLPANPWTPILGAAPAPTLSIAPAPEPPIPPTPTPDPDPTPVPSGDTSDQSGESQTSSITGNTTGDSKVPSNLTPASTESIKERLENTLLGNVFIDTAEGISKTAMPITLASLAATVTVISTIASLAAMFFSQVSIKEFILMMLNYLLSIFKTRNKDKFGLIYDQLTKKPLPGAIIRLFEYGTMKMIATTVSDSKGHFFFAVKPGQYVISVIKKGFIFPSKTASQEAHYMEQAYFGQTIRIAVDASVITVKIPLDRTIKSKIKRPIFLDLLTSNAVRYTILITGSAISIFIMLSVGGLSNFLMTSLYLILWIFEFITQHKEYKFNRVYDRSNKSPIDLAVVRVMSENGKLVETNVSDFKGRFVAKISSQSDKISIDRVGYQHIEAEPKIAGLLEGKKYYLNKI